MLQMLSNAAIPIGSLISSTDSSDQSSPKTEIRAWGHWLGGVQLHNGRAYLLREPGKFSGLSARGERRGVWSTVPQVLLPLCTRHSWGTDRRAVGQEHVEESPEGRKGNGSSTRVRRGMAVGKCEETGARGSHTHHRRLNRPV